MRAALLLPLLVACGTNPADSGTPSATDSGSAHTPTDYSQPGAAAPGTLQGTVVGSTGTELPVQVWYPAEPSDQDPITYDGFYAGGAFEGATPICNGPRPVLVFSHGNSGVRWQSPFFTEYLASHGWVVVAPDHVGNTLFDMGDVPFAEVILRRPLDLQDSFDWLVAETGRADSPLFGCIDETNGYAVAGHSFGGFTAYSTAGASFDHPTTGVAESRTDDRVWAAIAMAPWDVGGRLNTGMAEISVPVLTLGGTLDVTTPWTMIAGLHETLTTTPRFLGEFPEAGHFSFAPVSCLVFEGDGCGDGFLDLETFTTLVNASSLAFLEGAQGVEGAHDALPEHPALRWTAER